MTEIQGSPRDGRGESKSGDKFSPVNSTPAEILCSVVTKLQRRCARGAVTATHENYRCESKLSMRIAMRRHSAARKIPN
jgi:hypothetical protein